MPSSRGTSCPATREPATLPLHQLAPVPPGGGHMVSAALWPRFRRRLRCPPFGRVTASLRTPLAQLRRRLQRSVVSADLDRRIPPHRALADCSLAYTGRRHPILLLYVLAAEGPAKTSGRHLRLRWSSGVNSTAYLATLMASLRFPILPVLVYYI